MHDEEAKEVLPDRVIRSFERHKRTLPRWERPGAIYHVRASVLPNRHERLVQAALGNVLRNALHYDDGRRYALHCYVIMPDQFHALLEPRRRDDGFIPVFEIMGMIKGVSARRINQRVGRSGPFWRDGSYTRIIRCSDEYAETYHYIWCNPFAAGLVEHPDEWPWWWERRV